MKDKDKDMEKDGGQPTAPAQEPVSDRTPETEQAPTEADEAQARIAALEAQVKERDDRYLRLAAEYDNFRRRSREEKEALYDGAVADAVKALLPIVDNLERAAGYEDGGQVREGLVLTAKSVQSAWHELRVEAYGTVGDTFDPALHNAVMHDEDPERGEGEIVEVFQRGYRRGKQVIRFAMVKTVN